MDMQHATVEERKIIYRARRGLKELDLYFDPYIRHHYLNADPTEKAAFATLIAQEDPDLLDWFMNVSQPEEIALQQIVARIKALHQYIV